jgi:hypothetical protein
VAINDWRLWIAGGVVEIKKPARGRFFESN